MNFVKSNIAKKIIIILITLMIFNIAVPKTTKAIDLGGIFFKPTASAILIVLITIDTSIGIFLTSTSFALTGFGEIITQLNDLAETIRQSDSSGTNFGKKIGESLADAANAHLSKIFIGPDTIFSGDLKMLDANIFNVDTKLDFRLNMQEDEQEDTSIDMSHVFQDSNLIGTIKVGIASTYVTLRNLAALIMLGGLIFSGIRMLVSSNIPTQKQEWLRILQDWIIGMALLIFSHVIMVMIFWVSDKLTIGLRKSVYGFGGLNFQLILQCLLSLDYAEQVVSLAMLGYMIYLTVVFAVAYFKRLLWVCVLIVIAPITSTMYAFGRQGKSIYSRWLKEYAMTVLVQPYHLIIYYTLVSVPLNLVNSTGGGFLLADPGSTLAAVYGLIAMSMIRPAEKWIRELFGMHTGVASMASFDSGKQTIDAVAKAVSDVAKKVVTTVVAIKTGGASAMLSKGVGAMASKGVGQAVSKVGAKAGANAGKGKGIGDMAGKVFGEGQSEGPGAGLGNGPDIDIAPPKGNGENVPKAQESDAPQSENRLQQGAESVNTQLQTNGADSSGQITASNLTINAGKVDMQSSNVEDKGQTSSKKDESSDSDEETRAQKAERSGDQSVSRTTSEEEETDIKTPAGFMNHFRGAGNTSDEELAAQYQCESVEEMLRDMGGFSEEEISKYLKKDESEEKDNGEGFELKEAPASFWEEFQRIKGAYSAAGADTELLGLGNEVYKGVNSVRDTFYVSSAPQDWKNTSGLIDDRKKQIDEDKKKKKDQKESAFIKDEGNKQFMFDNLKIEGKSVMDYYRGVYKGKSEDYIAEKANDRVEQELEKMKGYAKYGMNAAQAYPIYQLQKKNGYTTEQALVEHASYQEFNNDEENVAYINESIKNQIDIHNQKNPNDIKPYLQPIKTVEEGLTHLTKDEKGNEIKIDNTKYYYEQGYKGIKDLARVDFLQQKLNTTKERAVELDRALRRTGAKLNDTGKRKGETDDKYKERVRTYFDINKAYKELREKRG